MNTLSSDQVLGLGLRSSQQQSNRLTKLGWGIVVGAIFPIGLWSAITPLSMAVVAPAFVKVDLNRRPVQHLEGGIVRLVLVRDGQRVNAGDPILILGDVGVDADRNRLAYRVNVERAALARLDAEQRLAKTLVFAKDLLEVADKDERVKQGLIKESALFEARRDSLVTEVRLMLAQREKIEQEILALQSQIAQAQQSLALQKKDLEANRGLLTDGFISPTRHGQIESALMDYSSKIEERRSEVARAQQRLVDTDLKIKSLQNLYMKTASDQLKETASKLNEIEQERRKYDDASVRQVVTAPATGEVMDLKFTSPGAILRPGDSIAEIVPTDARLMIEAQVRPEEINNVMRDQSARIKFTSFKYRNTSMVTGKVTYVSADRLIDKASNMPYYSVMILADADSVHAALDLKLQAGMPAEVYIDGSTQTPLEYLAAPITSTMRRAARQL